MRHIGADELRALVPLPDAVDVLARVFGERPPATAQRTAFTRAPAICCSCPRSVPRSWA
jgi:hypothetical protein